MTETNKAFNEWWKKSGLSENVKAQAKAHFIAANRVMVGKEAKVG